MPLHDLLAYRESDAGARILLPAVQPFEDYENLFGVNRIKTDAVIGHREYPLPVAFLRRDMHPRFFIAPEFYGIAQQILKQLDHL